MEYLDYLLNHYHKNHTVLHAQRGVDQKGMAVEHGDSRGDSSIIGKVWETT